MISTRSCVKLASSLFFFAVFTLTSALHVDYADARPGASGGAMRSGPAAGGSVRGGHRANRMDRQSNRRDSRMDRADNRRDNRREVGDSRRENREDVRKERREWHEDRWRRHRARHITRAAFRSLSCRRTTIIVNGITYHSCGGNYYERVYQGGTVVYVIVSAPPGY